ncbi:hypothetical protein N6H05_10790 [Sphingobium sp. WTD-1]|uniref:hypothetical protein n=1 Tax=Sphingobium sp. WTD-1 TaxID=2979467 RepID=UPI0024DE8DC4|nr:hypothetical protein [Sphingobium sp. WTD-1]WIA58252.1 hypothetical protein N6H05_10790 [Sphingobium sp. WTD-1]
MMTDTILTQLPFVNQGSVGLLGIDPAVLDDEDVVALDLRLVFWGRARDALHAADWTSRAIGSEFKMVPGGAAMPTQITGLDPDPLCDRAVFNAAVWAAYNERHALVFGAGALNGHLMASSALSTHLDAFGGDFTIIFFGRPGPGDNAFPFGNNQVATAASSGMLLQWTSAGGLTFQVNGTQIIANTATASPAFASVYADGPRLIVLAFSDNLNKCRLRIDAGLYDREVTSVTAFNTDSTIRLGLAGSNLSGPIDGGDCGEFIVLRGYLTDDPVMLARIEKLIMDHYRKKPKWWGVSASTALTEAQAKALGGGERSTTRAKSFTVTAADQYVYYAYPSAEARSAAAAYTSYRINGADAVPTQTTVVINSVNHIVLRSPTTLTGSITVEVT